MPATLYDAETKPGFSQHWSGQVPSKLRYVLRHGSGNMSVTFFFHQAVRTFLTPTPHTLVNPNPNTRSFAYFDTHMTVAQSDIFFGCCRFKSMIESLLRPTLIVTPSLPRDFEKYNSLALIATCESFEDPAERLPRFLQLVRVAVHRIWGETSSGRSAGNQLLD